MARVQAEVVSIVWQKEAGRMGCGFDLYAYFSGNNGAAALLEKVCCQKTEYTLLKGYEAMGRSCCLCIDYGGLFRFLDRKSPLS